MSYTNTPEGFRAELELLDERLEFMHINDVSTSATRLRHSAVIACRGASMEWLESYQTLLGTVIERARRRARNQRKTSAFAAFLSAVLIALGTFAKAPILPNWLAFAMIFFGIAALGIGASSAFEVSNWEKDVLPPFEEALKRVETAIEKAPVAGHPHRSTGRVRIDAGESEDETPGEPLTASATRTEKTP